MREPTPIPPRRSATIDAHRAGHSINHHPEDVPYITAQKKRYANPLDLADNLDFQDEPTRSPTGARRWVDTKGNQVIQRGNQRFVIHDELPPKRRVHWVLILWIGMLSMLAFYLLWNWGTTWWTDHQLYATYGFPRTYQTDQVVGHADSTDHPSHFIALNLNGHIEVIEFPGGDGSHARIYIGPQLFGDNAILTPVTLSFKDVNGDGKPDLLLHVQDQ